MRVAIIVHANTTWSAWPLSPLFPLPSLNLIIRVLPDVLLAGTAAIKIPHGSYVRNIENCNLGCLDSDAFDFPGASNVTEVNIKYNNFLALPEKLLWNMSLLQFEAENLVALQTLPEKFFLGQSNLQTIQFRASSNLGAQQRLPEKLFQGLTSLSILGLTDCKVQNMPNMDDLKVGALFAGACLPRRRPDAMFLSEQLLMVVPKYTGGVVP